MVNESEILERLGATSDPAEQYKLIDSLRDVATEASLPTLRPLLQSSESKVRMGTMNILERIGGSEAAGVLATALDHEDSTTVAWTAIHLRKMKAYGQGPAVTHCAQTRRETLSVDARSALAHAMGVLSDPDALEVLNCYLHDPKASVRTSAVLALRRRQTAEARDVLSQNVGTLPWRTNRLAKRVLRSM